MADKTATSSKFSITLSDGTKIPELRTRSTYELTNDGAARDARVDLLKQITEAEYDALPKDVKTTQLAAASGGPNLPQTKTEYYAILASRPPGRGSDYNYNNNVLNAISIRDTTNNRNH